MSATSTEKTFWQVQAPLFSCMAGEERTSRVGLENRKMSAHHLRLIETV